MQFEHAFSATQIVGYLAFILGVASFLQKNDLRFKVLMSAECVCYVIHFGLFGNYTAAASATVSVIRSVAAMKTRSPWVAAFFVALSLAVGFWFGTSWVSALPITAACIGTYALFFLHGVRMRAAMLIGTCLWLLNNIIAGSIGGTLLEVAVLGTNLFTISRMRMAQKKQPTATST